MQCRECSAECGYELVEIGSATVVRRLCDACWGDARNQYASMQAEYAALLASGVHRRIANRIMCVRYGL